MRTARKTTAFFIVISTAWCAVAARGDEGMWLFSDPPGKMLAQRHGFELSREWLDNLQRASVRFNLGGSGSFVSGDGLVMTNHHVGFDSIQKLSTSQRDYITTGFYAKTPDEELPCHDLELNVLASIEDVTERVEAAVPPGSEPEEAHKARLAAMNTIEKESLDTTGLRSDVVALYHGGLYHLYRFKKYTDVRLVFAPEQDIAFFGGDPDNFTFPRYDLDVCFFRVWEDGKPAKIEHFLKWSKTGAREEEVVFISGHPGRTNRLNTVAHLEFLRDRALPERLDELRRGEVLVSAYGERLAENARRAKRDLYGFANARKAQLGALAGLQDPAILACKRADEATLRSAVLADRALATSCGAAWDKIAAALAAWDGIYQPHRLLEDPTVFNCALFPHARTLVRLAEESAKPNAERLREYRESNLASLEQSLFSEAPIHKDLETIKLADWLARLVEKLGADDELVVQILAGKSPAVRAEELVRSTRLDDPAVRRELAEGGQKAIDASDDPMILLARLVDARARELRAEFERKVEEPMQQAYGEIAKARFALAGKDVYPDATFTLRLSVGVIRGYDEGGMRIPAWTTIGGAYDYAAARDNQPPFRLPESWIDRRDRLDPQTPMNFVSTNDIIGGNSGSPVVNRAGEVVGLVFDGNIQSLVWGFVFDEEVARAVSVDCRAIDAALRDVYDAAELAAELGRGRTD
ncbi:MAG: S46 family peptidase [Pirellulales bacterium]|nr:S46 family peptidase [Pirellulales bacterium]